MEAVAAAAVAERKPDDGEARCRQREGARAGVTSTWFRQAQRTLGYLTSVYRHFQPLFHLVRLFGLVAS